MSTSTLDHKLANALIGAIADCLNTEISTLKESKRKVNRTQSCELMSVFTEKLTILYSSIKLNTEANLKLSQAINNALDFLPALKNESACSITDLFHTFWNSGIPLISTAVMVRIGISNKLSKNMQDEFITQTVALFDDNDSVHMLEVYKDTFNGLSHEEQVTWFNRIVDLYNQQSIAQIQDWIFKNLEQLAEHSIVEDIPKLAFEIHMRTLGLDSDFIYGHGEDQMNISILPVIKIRHHLFGGLDKFEQINQTAEALGCATDRTYWQSVLVKSNEPELSLAAIEM